MTVARRVGYCCAKMSMCRSRMRSHRMCSKLCVIGFINNIVRKREQAINSEKTSKKLSRLSLIIKNSTHANPRIKKILEMLIRFVVLFLYHKERAISRRQLKILKFISRFICFRPNSVQPQAVPRRKGKSKHCRLGVIKKKTKQNMMI